MRKDRILTHKEFQVQKLEPGMCICYPNLPYRREMFMSATPEKAEKSFRINKNHHPYLILSIGKDTMTCILTETLEHIDEGKNRQDLIMSTTNSKINIFEIKHPHPPMESEQIRRQCADALEVIEIPFEKFWDNENAYLCNDGGLKMNPQALEKVNENVRHAMRDLGHPEPLDPWNTCYLNYLTEEEYKALHPKENGLPVRPSSMEKLNRMLGDPEQDSQTADSTNPNTPNMTKLNREVEKMDKDSQTPTTPSYPKH